MKRIATIEDKSINVISSFKTNEVEVIDNKYNYINEFKSLNTNFELFHSKYKEIIDAIESDKNNVLDLVISFLNIYKTFLFHWEKTLKGKYGKQSIQVKEFLKSTNEEYDNYFSYRLINIMRNYIQHSGYFKITVSKKLEDDNQTSYSLNLSIQELLQDERISKKLTEEEQKIDMVNLLTIFTENINSLYRINNVALNYHFDIEKIYRYCNDVLELERYKKVWGQQIVILGYKNFINNELDGLDILQIDFEYLKFIKKDIAIYDAKLQPVCHNGG